MNESTTMPIYHPRRKKSVPRPYSAEEMALAWTLLDGRGNARVRFAVAITQEAGLRLGEICQLRVQDIDVVAQRCFLRGPNMTTRDRYGFFGNKTKLCFEELLSERDPGLGHDALLYNGLKNPYRAPMLIDEISRTLCKTHRGRLVNETGFDRWTIYRLRHTWVCNLVSGGADMKTVMTNGGWKLTGLRSAK
jgi:integrase